MSAEALEGAYFSRCPREAVIRNEGIKDGNKAKQQRSQCCCIAQVSCKVWTLRPLLGDYRYKRKSQDEQPVPVMNGHFLIVCEHVHYSGSRF